MSWEFSLHLINTVLQLGHQRYAKIGLHRVQRAIWVGEELDAAEDTFALLRYEERSLVSSPVVCSQQL